MRKGIIRIRDRVTIDHREGERIGEWKRNKQMKDEKRNELVNETRKKLKRKERGKNEKKKGMN